MAYDKHTWTCDEPITVERLNHIEDGIANAGGGDCGFECEEDVTLLTEETVTTTAQGDFNGGQLSYSQLIDAETIRVTFDGTEYECPRIALSSTDFYGGFDPMTGTPDFSQYPFVIVSIDGSGNEIATETTGTYTIKIEAMGTIVTTTPCFEKARGYWCEEGMVTLTEESVTTTMEEGNNAAFGNLSYSQPIDADSIAVTFDGVEYECPRLSNDTYGAPYDQSTNTFDWSEYPFSVFDNNLATETAGTYSVKIETMQEVVTTTPCFEKAVQAVVLQKSLSPLILTQSGSPVQLDRTFGEISNAYLNGRAVLLDPQYNTKHYYSMVSLAITNTTNPQPGGRIVFGGETTQAFSASSESDYPVLETT